MINSGKPCECAVSSETTLDFPISNEPPITADAAAAPLVARSSDASKPFLRKSPLSMAHRNGVAASSIAEVARSVVSACAATRTRVAALRQWAAARNADREAIRTS